MCAARYLVDAPEGLQRFAGERHVKLRSLRACVLTTLRLESVGGLAGPSPGWNANHALPRPHA